MAEPLLFSREAEQSVLGGLFVSPVALADVAVLVKANDFAEPRHRLLFATLQAMDAERQPIDLVTVAERLEAAGQLSDGDMAYLVVLVRDTPSAANVLAYAGIVRSYAQRRRLLALADQLATWTREQADPAQTMTNLRAALNAIDAGQAFGGPKALAELLPGVLAELDQRANRTQALLGLSSSLPDVDRLLDGFCAGRLYVIAGRPGSGKSVFGLQTVRAALLAGKRALLFSLEMPATEVIHRLLAAEIPLPLGTLQSARLSEADWSAVTNTCASIWPQPLWIDDSSQLSIADLQSRARRLHRLAPLDVVVVDYLGLMDGERRNGEYSNRVQEVSSITRALKQLAKELSLPVIVLAQLNRTLEQRGDKRPILSDLRESGSIEQDADVVAFVYRDELHHPDTPDKDCAELLIRKNRSGKTGMIPLRFDGEYCRFQPLAGSLPSQATQSGPPGRHPGFSHREAE